MPTGMLEVVIAEGRRLKDKDTVGQSDPFVEIYTHKKYKQRTTTKSNTSDPVWNERFTLNITPQDDTIYFDVYDADVGDKDAIGNGKVKLKNVFDDGKFDEWVKLPAHLGLSVHGEIHVIMSFTVSISSCCDHQPRIACIQYSSLHNHQVCSFITNTITNTKLTLILIHTLIHNKENAAHAMSWSVDPSIHHIIVSFQNDLVEFRWITSDIKQGHLIIDRYGSKQPIVIHHTSFE